MRVAFAVLVIFLVFVPEPGSAMVEAAATAAPTRDPAARDSLEAVPALLRSGRAADAARLAGRQIARLEAAPIADSVLYSRALDAYVEALGRSSLPVDSVTMARARLALGMRERADGPIAGRTAQSLGNLARLLQRQRNLADARPLFERAVAIRRVATPPDSSALAAALNLLGTNCRQLREYPCARQCYEEALAIREAILPANSSDIAVVLNNLGLTWRDLGEYAAAQTALERAVAIFEALHPPTHPYVYTTRNSLAIALVHRGDLRGARTEYERALEGIHAGAPPDSGVLAGYLQNYGMLLQDLADYASALRAHREAGAILERLPATPDSLAIETQRVNLALCYLRMGRLGDAEALLTDVRGMEERRGERNPAVLAAVLHDLSVIRREQSRFDESIALADRALEVHARAPGGDSAFVATVLEDRARALRGAGRLPEARAALERSLALRERLFGPGSDPVADCLASLARVLADQGLATEAFEAALRGETIARERSRETIRYLGEEQSLLYASRARGTLGMMLAMAADAAESGTPDTSRNRRAFDALIRSRAVMLDELAARHRAESSAEDPEILRLAARHRAVRERLAGLLVRAASEPPDDRATAALVATRAEAESLGRALAGASALHRLDEVRAHAGLEEIAQSLGAEDALVGFARSEGDSGQAMAFVLRAGHGGAEPDPILVPLARAATIDASVRAWREAVMRADRAASGARAKESARIRHAGEFLRARVWDPVVPHLEGARRVFVVPEGDLALVSWYALPVGASGYLADEDRTMHLLSTERDLLLNRLTDPRSGGILVVGNVDFEHARPASPEPPASRMDAPSVLAVNPGASAAPQAVQAPYRSGVSSCRDFREARFLPLPATRTEAREVLALWSAPSGSNGARLLEGAAATEADFKREAPGCRIIHAATHGFFLREDCSARRSGGDERFENPLLLSGLVLAGANRRAIADSLSEDGILTAEEVSSLALADAEWVVLSACNSGVGAIVSGEGVLGLRRAFQIAGAHTVITSLWPVNDRAARRWMRLLYEARMRDGRSTDEAVRQATRGLLAERRATGADTNPATWAAFVAVGDWR